MTKKEYEVIGSLNMTDQISNEAYGQIMIVAEDEPEECEDCISRQAVLDINEHHHGQMPNHVNHEIWKEIKTLPPVTPTPKIGRWILLDECANSGYYCSECQKKVVKEGWSDTVKKIKYCPNCGAKMQEVEE